MTELTPALIGHVNLLLESHARQTGRALLPPAEDRQPAAERALAAHRAPWVLVSHGLGEDPLLNYANRTALALWELDWETLLHTPSRLTAEAMVQEARAHFLEQVARDGFVAGYQGVRISASGRRFRIVDTTVWNVVDGEGALHGQAATFAAWEYL